LADWIAESEFSCFLAHKIYDFRFVRKLNNPNKGKYMNSESDVKKHHSMPKLVGRGVFGGFLMGMANLVPGISGGTMLVAAGIYKDFIDAIAEVTTFRCRLRSMVLFLSVVIAAAAAIVVFAGMVKGLVVDCRWVMYSIFIGLTLGGVPVIWKMIKGGAGAGFWIGAAVGLACMAVLAWYQQKNHGAICSAEGFGFIFIAGIIGAVAMILPGISGGYMLLLLGVYVPVLGAIDACKIALKTHELAAAKEPFIQYILPMTLGVILGIVVISNILKMVLAKFEKPTLGVLMGLLIGAVMGLWPFQQGVVPKAGDVLKGEQVIVIQSGDVINGNMVVEIDREIFVLDGSRKVKYPAGLALAVSGKPIPQDKYPTEFFKPAMWQTFAAAGLVLAGFFTTFVISRISADE